MIRRDASWMLGGRTRTVGRLVAQARSNVVIAMLHRFAIDPPDASFVDPHAFERDLLQLKKRGWRFSSLREVTEALAVSESLPPTMVITVDDGYADFVELGVPALAAVGCPATIFATAGFLDGSCWFWWDQVEHALATGRGVPVTITLGGRSVTVAPDGRTDGGVHVVDVLKRVSDDELRRFVGQLADLHGVAIDGAPPDRYRPASWTELRLVAADGFDVGPHTLTHPILSQVDDATAQEEMSGGWARVQAEMGSAAVPVACYPNGKLSSFGDREIGLAVACGLTAGVTATHEMAVPMRAPGADMFRIPRIGWHRRLIRFGERPMAFGATYTAYSFARKVRHRAS